MHQVTNAGAVPAVSVHVYAPALRHMNTYRVEPRPAGPHRHRAGGGGLVTAVLQRPQGARSIDELLAEARPRIDRLRPRRTAAARMAAGALLVDIRPPGTAEGGRRARRPGRRAQRARVAARPGQPDARLPQAITGYDVEVIVLCTEGYTSSLAADTLRSLGLSRSVDVIGGFRAWAAAVPVVPGLGRLTRCAVAARGLRSPSTAPAPLPPAAAGPGR